MKKFYLILFLFTLCFSGCASAQEVEQLPLFRVNAKVDRIAGDEVTLYTTSVGNIYAATVEGLKEQKAYTFWLELNDGKPGEPLKATIVKFSITTYQAQSDLDAIPKELSNRTIKKL